MNSPYAARPAVFIAALSLYLDGLAAMLAILGWLSLVVFPLLLIASKFFVETGGLFYLPILEPGQTSVTWAKVPNFSIKWMLISLAISIICGIVALWFAKGLAYAKAGRIGMLLIFLLLASIGGYIHFIYRPLLQLGVQAFISSIHFMFLLGVFLKRARLDRDAFHL
jgi:hypothetical protein